MFEKKRWSEVCSVSVLISVYSKAVCVVSCCPACCPVHGCSLMALMDTGIVLSYQWGDNRNSNGTPVIKCEM